MPRPPVMACINAERGGQLGETIANGCHHPAVRNGEFLNKEGAMVANSTESKHGKKINQETEENWMSTGGIPERYPTYW